MTTSFTGTDGLAYLPGNAQDVGRREDQQDSFGFSDPDAHDFVAHGGLLAVIADGMGGLAHGAEASRLAVANFLDSYAAKAPGERIPDALERALVAANRSVVEFAAGRGLKREVGTTLVAAALCAGELDWVSVGDSALYLCREGRIKLLTRPHTLAESLRRAAERGEIAPEAARIDPENDGLTSYVGSDEVREVDASDAPIALTPGDFVMLCTDGLYRALGAEEMAGVLGASSDGQSAAEALVAAALARDLPNQDNVTALCVKIAVNR
ncbi:MAG TPA: protein phosphatase 2C domain-containing protein [Candidatus Binataceae bacterium]|nr:protein phosphatase 2C domain-containing protein [Candidatus Binataceae bacterium]HVB82901.1 protein phosphatase 2C domain-containing protein [Candidatus Binataceae bacterium]